MYNISAKEQLPIVKTVGGVICSTGVPFPLKSPFKNNDILDEIHLENISNFLTPRNYWFAKRKRLTE